MNLRVDDPGECALVFAADERFARPTAVAMFSALKNLSSALQPPIYILTNGISDGSQARLRHVSRRQAGREIHWLQVPPGSLLEHGGRRHLTATAYARLLIPQLLPASVRRAVYLDGDVLVTDDVSPLFHLSLDGAPFGAVRDFHVPTTDSERSSVRGLVEPKPYCNTGVLVIDPKVWRAEELTQRALAFARAAAEPLPFADQDAINAAADGWKELDARWNVQVLSMYWPELPRTELTDWLIDHRDELYRDAAVLHFGGLPKPWQPWSFATSRGKTAWAQALIESQWHSRRESLGWLVPWLMKRSLDAGRRVTGSRGGS